MSYDDGVHGPGRFIDRSGAKVLDSAVQWMADGTGDKLNELLRLELDGDEPYVALHVIDPSTSHRYILRVPPEHTTVKSALAWTFGMKESEYVLLQES